MILTRGVMSVLDNATVFKIKQNVRVKRNYCTTQNWSEMSEGYSPSGELRMLIVTQFSVKYDLHNFICDCEKSLENLIIKSNKILHNQLEDYPL